MEQETYRYGNEFHYKCNFCDFKVHSKLLMLNHIKKEHSDLIMRKEY